MSRYIDEISARENFQDVLAYMGSEVKRILKKVPTADVVAVVRCKDCKFATEYCHGDFECRCPHTPWASDEYAIPCKANDFCSYGERREG